jgi:hypothetical protein
LLSASLLLLLLLFMFAVDVLLLLLLLLRMFAMSLLQALVDFFVDGCLAVVVLQRHLQGTCNSSSAVSMTTWFTQRVWTGAEECEERVCKKGGEGVG